MRQERAPFALAAGAGSLPLVRGAAAVAAVGAAEHRGPGAFKPRKRPVVRVGAPAPGFGPGTTAVQLPEASQTVIAAGGRPLFDRWGRSCCGGVVSATLRLSLRAGSHFLMRFDAKFERIFRDHEKQAAGSIL
jgi:hypothetical protein